MKDPAQTQRVREALPSALTASAKREISRGSRVPRQKGLELEQGGSDMVNHATTILSAVEAGDPQAADQLLGLVYDELRRLAAFKMAQQAPGNTLQATALVHEAWLRLVGTHAPSFKNRSHFFSAAAEAMRHILIDRARRKQTQRHGAGLVRVDFDRVVLAAQDPNEQLLAVHEALKKLESSYPIQAELVKLRYFAGMTNEEVAQLLGISVSTAKNYWNFARGWLFSEIVRQ